MAVLLVSVQPLLPLGCNACVYIFYIASKVH